MTTNTDQRASGATDPGLPGNTYPHFEAWPMEARKLLDAEWHRDFGIKARFVVAAMTMTQEETVEMARENPEVTLEMLDMFTAHEKAAKGIAEAAQNAVARMIVAMYQAHGLPWDEEATA